MNHLNVQGNTEVTGSNSESQKPTPQKPSQLLPSSDPIRSPTDFPGTQFNASLYANSPDFFSSTDHDAVDHEHLDRVPTGGSVIDTNAVYDDSGRSFHGYKEGRYFAPNDAAEQDRLDLQHAALLLLLNGKLYCAPIQNPEYALDVGTGTGIWATQFAEQNPSCQVIGTDLSPIQPKPSVPNCSFILDDAEEEWLFGSTDDPIRFDYVHLRAVMICFNDPRKVMREAYKNMKPGGWIEYMDASSDIQSIDGNIKETAIGRWTNLMVEGMALNGRDLNAAQYYKQWLEEVGFVDVEERKLIVPANPWPENKRMKQVGYYMLENICEGLRGIGWKTFKNIGLTAEEIEQLVVDAKRDASNPKNRWFGPWYLVFGRKPL